MSSVVAYDLFSASAAVLDSSDALAAQLTRSAKIAMPAAVLGATLGLIAADSADKADFDEKELARAIQQAQDGCGEASRTLAELQKQRGNMQEVSTLVLRLQQEQRRGQRLCPPSFFSRSFPSSSSAAPPGASARIGRESRRATSCCRRGAEGRESGD